MKTHYANWWFGAAILACWSGLLMTNLIEKPETSSRLVTLSAAEMAGVQRVVWDVEADSVYSKYFRKTKVVLGWSGDMRAYTHRPDAQSPALKFVREGETVYVRLDLQDPHSWSQKMDDNRGYHRRYSYLSGVLPESLSLPASVTEIVWPAMHLVVSKSSTTPLSSFTVYAHDLEIGGYEPHEFNDVLIQTTEKNRLSPGLLRHLTVYSQAQLCHCRNKRNRDQEGDDVSQAKSGDLKYSGGRFEQLHVYSKGGSIDMDAGEPGLKTYLYTTPRSSLKLDKISFLNQIQILDLPEEKLKVLEPPISTGSDTSASRP